MTGSHGLNDLLEQEVISIFTWNGCFHSVGHVSVSSPFDTSILFSTDMPKIT